MAEDAQKAGPVTHFGVVVYPGFQALDAFGPLDILNTLALKRNISLSIIAPTLDPVSTKPPTMPLPQGSNFAQSIVPTHTFADPPKDLHVLIVPGGYGIRAENGDIHGAVAFIQDVYPKLKHLFTVCTGSLLAARAGVLDGRNATTNKNRFTVVKAECSNVHWIPHARWVQDGNIWTSSGVTAGIDGMFAFVAATWGEAVAEELANTLEYERHTDPSWDPFAKLYGL